MTNLSAIICGVLLVLAGPPASLREALRAGWIIAGMWK